MTEKSAATETFKRAYVVDIQKATFHKGGKTVAVCRQDDLNQPKEFQVYIAGFEFDGKGKMAHARIISGNGTGGFREYNQVGDWTGRGIDVQERGRDLPEHIVTPQINVKNDSQAREIITSFVQTIRPLASV